MEMGEILSMGIGLFSASMVIIIFIFGVKD